MTSNFMLDFRLFRSNRVTRFPISKYLHSFCVESFISDKEISEPFVNLLPLRFSISWDLVYPTFTVDWSFFSKLPPPLRQKSQQVPLLLLLMSTKFRHTCSYQRTKGTLQAQENKSSTLQNMISLDNISWHPYFVPEVKIPELDRVLTHMGKNGEPCTKLGTN